MIKATNLVEVALPKDVPPGWRRTTLGEIGEYINGRGFKKSEWSNKGLPIIRIQNLTGTGKEQNYYDGDIDERHVVNPGDLLISWAATLGAYLWTGPRAALNQHIFKVRSFVDKKFHFYLMQHILGDLYRQTHGSGMVHITKSKFDSMPVLVPETEDQQKVVVAEIEKQFSRLDEAVANLKRVKANLKRYKASVLQSVTSGRLTTDERRTANTTAWRWLTIAELASLEPRSIQSGPFGSNLRHSEFQTSGRLVIGIDNVRDGEFSLGSNHRISDAKFQELAKYAARPGDVLITVMATIGRVCVVPESIEPAIITKHVYRITVNRQLALPDYVAIALRGSHEVREQLMASVQGQTRPGLNGGLIKKIRVPIPPLAEQHRIVVEVDRRLSLLSETEAQVNANLRRAERLRQSILNRAFTGYMQ